MINQYITALVNYGLQSGLIHTEDKVYTVNRLLELLQLEEYEEGGSLLPEMPLEDILGGMLDYAYEQGILTENSVVYRDLFDTKIMGILIPRPSEVIGEFQTAYKISPENATDYYYKLSQDTDYIRRYRIARDIKWVTKMKVMPAGLTTPPDRTTVSFQYRLIIRNGDFSIHPMFIIMNTALSLTMNIHL